MARRLFTLLSALSLLLFMAVVVLWVRSYRTADYVARGSATEECGVISTVGRLVLYREFAIGAFRWPGPPGFIFAQRPAPGSMRAYAPSTTTRYTDFLGFGVITGDTGRYTIAAWTVPYWSMALVAAMPSGLWLRRRASKSRSGRQRRGLCPQCGYDLRATPGRCPECGAVANRAER